MTASWTPDDANDALNAAGHAVIVTDTAGVVRFWNEAARELYGWTVEEAVGRRATELIDPRGPGLGEATVRAIAEGHGRAMNFRARRKDGTIVPVLVTARPMRGSSGAVDGIIATSVDMTARAEAEEAAANAQARLDVIGAITSIGTWEWDLATDELHGDRSLNDMHGTAPDAGWSIDVWINSIHADDRELMLRAATADFASDGLMPEVKYRVPMPDGSTRVLLGRGEVIEWRDGAPAKIGGVVVDVTDAQRDAQRVLENLEAMSDGYLSVDDDWRVTYVNHAGESLLGQRRDHMIGRVLWDVFPEAVGSPFEQNYRAAVDTGVGTEFEAYFEPHEAWYDIRAYPSDGALAVYFRNINDRRAAIEAQARLLEAERAARRATEEASHRLEHAATHDSLTGLANRVALEEHLAEAIARQDGAVAVLFCDLDRFKYVNDSLGHRVGDQILIAVAARLCSCLRPEDVVARIGGDEFIVAIRVEDPIEAVQIAERMIAVVREPVDASGRRLVTTMSVGIAISDAAATPGSLLRDADAAVYRSKDKGRNQASLFDDALRDAALIRLEVEHDLRIALEADQFGVVFQPGFDAITGRAVGAEALVRWHHPTRGVIAPGEFIPLAEETGLIVPLGHTVLRKATEEITARLQPAGAFTLWVNVSGQELAEPSFVNEVRRRQEAMTVSLGLEVTETDLLDDPIAAGRVLESLARSGVKLAIDDFGTGYSSLARLTDYPIDVVKVDQSFVAQPDSRKHWAIVAAAIDLAHALGALALAEGVETDAQLRGLQDLGCDLVSGFYLARPVAIGDLAAAIAPGEETVLRTRQGATRR